MKEPLTILESTASVANIESRCSAMRHNIVVTLTVITVLLLSSIPTLKGLWGLWHSNENFGSFIFVPYMCGYILYQRRKSITSITLKHTKNYLYVLPLGLAAMIAAAFWGYPRISGILLILNLLAATAGTAGAGNMPILAGPILFLILMVPPPTELIATIILNLQKLFSVSLEFFLNAFCSRFHERSGIAFWFYNREHPILIAPECSGIKSLIGFTLSSFFFMVLDKQKVWAMAVLLTWGIMIALVMNFARITISIYFRVYGLAEYATGFWHGLLGILLYAMGFCILMKFSDLLKNECD